MTEGSTGLSGCLHTDREYLLMWEPNFVAVHFQASLLSFLLLLSSVMSCPPLAFKLLCKIQCNATSPGKPSIPHKMSQLSLFPQCVISASIICPSHNLMGYISFTRPFHEFYPLNRETKVQKPNLNLKPHSLIEKGNTRKPEFLVLMIN